MVTTLSHDALLAQLDHLPDSLDRLELLSPMAVGAEADPEGVDPGVIRFVVTREATIDHAVISRLPAVRELRVDGLTIKEGMVGAMLARVGDLDSLTLRACGLEENDAGALVSNLRHDSLTELAVPHNDLGGQGIYDIVASQRSLTRLDVSANKLGDTPAAALGRLIDGGNIPIEVLDLSRTKVDDAGVAKLAEVQIPTLRQLNLERNLIGDKGAKALATASFALDELDLSGNYLKRGGADAIIQRWPHLEVDVGDTSFGIVDVIGVLVPTAIAFVLATTVWDASTSIALAVAAAVLIVALWIRSATSRVSIDRETLAKIFGNRA